MRAGSRKWSRVGFSGHVVGRARMARAQPVGDLGSWNLETRRKTCQCTLCANFKFVTQFWNILFEFLKKQGVARHALCDRRKNSKICRNVWNNASLHVLNFHTDPTNTPTVIAEKPNWNQTFAPPCTSYRTLQVNYRRINFIKLMFGAVKLVA